MRYETFKRSATFANGQFFSTNLNYTLKATSGLNVTSSNNNEVGHLLTFCPFKPTFHSHSKLLHAINTWIMIFIYIIEWFLVTQLGLMFFPPFFFLPFLLPLLSFIKFCKLTSHFVNKWHWNVSVPQCVKLEFGAKKGVCQNTFAWQCFMCSVHVE